MSRIWYEVRVRENGTKKSRFYFAKDSSSAASMYKGSGDIMYAQKVSKEKLLGIGDFFTLGDKLLKELKFGGDSLEELEVKRELDRNKVKQRGYYERKRKETTDKYQ